MNTYTEEEVRVLCDILEKNSMSHLCSLIKFYGGGFDNQRVFDHLTVTCRKFILESPLTEAPLLLNERGVIRLFAQWRLNINK